MKKIVLIICNLFLALSLVGADTFQTKGLSILSKSDKTDNAIAVIGMVVSFILIIVILLMLNRDDKKYQ